METVYFVHMYFFYTVLLLLQLVLLKKKKHQLDFYLPVTGSLEERGKKIDDFWCSLSVLCVCATSGASLWC